MFVPAPLPGSQHVFNSIVPHSFRFCVNQGVSWNTSQLALWLSFMSCFLFADVGSAMPLRCPTYDDCFGWMMSLWRFLSFQSGVSCSLRASGSDPCGQDWKILFRQHQAGFICQQRRGGNIRSVWVLGKKQEEEEFGRLSAAAWTQPECHATILTGLRWREIRGCWPALRHSWNSKQQSQELKHNTQASHTPLLPLRLSRFLTSLLHAASL